LGAAAVVLQVWIYTSWVLSDDFRAVTTGADPVPGHDKTWAWILQATFTAGALFAVVFVVRKCVTQRRLTLEAKIAIAWLAVMWMDPMANYFRPSTCSTPTTNFGSWAGHIPGWISRRGGTSFALGINLACYTASVLGRHRRRQAHGRGAGPPPRHGTAGLVLVAGCSCPSWCSPVEDLLIHTGWLVWNGVPGRDTVARGRAAIPLTEVLAWGGTQTALATLFFLKERHGRAFHRARLERVTASGWRRTAVSLFSIIGFATVAQAAYGIISARWLLRREVDRGPELHPQRASAAREPPTGARSGGARAAPGSPPGATADQRSPPGGRDQRRRTLCVLPRPDGQVFGGPPAPDRFGGVPMPARKRLNPSLTRPTRSRPVWTCTWKAHVDGRGGLRRQLHIEVAVGVRRPFGGQRPRHGVLHLGHELMEPAADGGLVQPARCCTPRPRARVGHVANADDDAKAICSQQVTSGRVWLRKSRNSSWISRMLRKSTSSLVAKYGEVREEQATAAAMSSTVWPYSRSP